MGELLQAGVGRGVITPPVGADVGLCRPGRGGRRTRSAEGDRVALRHGETTGADRRPRPDLRTRVAARGLARRADRCHRGAGGANPLLRLAHPLRAGPEQRSRVDWTMARDVAGHAGRGGERGGGGAPAGGVGLRAWHQWDRCQPARAAARRGDHPGAEPGRDLRPVGGHAAARRARRRALRGPGQLRLPPGLRQFADSRPVRLLARRGPRSVRGRDRRDDALPAGGRGQHQPVGDARRARGGGRIGAGRRHGVRGGLADGRGDRGRSPGDGDPAARTAGLQLWLAGEGRGHRRRAAPGGRDRHASGLAMVGRARAEEGRGCLGLPP